MLYLVRHGRTAANAGGRLLGRADPPLDAAGEQQARAIAEALPEIDRVVSSPLRRAIDTAAALGVEPEIDDRWIELDYGELDGAELASVPADLWDRWQRDPAFRPPGGESLAEVGRRVREACDELASEAADQDVVVVSHVSPIKAAVAWALSVGDQISWRLYLAPGAHHAGRRRTARPGRPQLQRGGSPRGRAAGVVVRSRASLAGCGRSRHRCWW